MDREDVKNEYLEEEGEDDQSEDKDKDKDRSGILLSRLERL